MYFLSFRSVNLIISFCLYIYFQITGSKRPKNSALEVDLDFQHNRRRPPIEEEENTASIEDIIIKRIREVCHKPVYMCQVSAFSDILLLIHEV